MKILFSFLALIALPLTVHGTPLPSDPCGGLHQPCTEWMKDLHADFLEAQDLQYFSGAYTGHCYYHSRDYRNDHRHYAALLLEVNQENVMHFNGVFSFFAPPHRYDDWNLESSRARISDPFRRPVTSFGDHSMADYMPDGGIWKFWVSQNPETYEIYLISYWGFFQRGFCRFNLVDAEF